MKYLPYSLKVLLILAVFSCDEFCEESTRTAMVINFYSSDTGLKTPRNVSIHGLDIDSVLYNKINTDVALCPLNPGADSTAYIIQSGDDADTLTIVYTRHTGFISSECGCANFADITEIQPTHHAIKEVQISNSSVGPISYRNNVIHAENIKIYY